jgi:hypothetical protein
MLLQAVEPTGDNSILGKIAPALLIILPIVVGWMLTEWGKIREERRNKKTERFENLILSLKGFYENTESTDLKQEFINQFYLSWLYCSDDFIKKVNEFLKSVNAAIPNEDKRKDKEVIVGELMVMIRKNFNCYTELESKDFTPVSPLFKK